MSESQSAEQLPLPGGNFRLFITRLSYQGLMSLGMLENPVTKTKAVILDNARMIIDDLSMLQDKTSGNLDPDEKEHLDKLVSDLERAYAEIESQPVEHEE
jgi:Domain of unknown function (DUF1844)